MPKKLKVTINTAIDIKKIRDKTGLGISAFATILGVTHKTVEAWEKGTKIPSTTAHNFLLVINKHPNLAKQAILDTVKMEEVSW